MSEEGTPVNSPRRSTRLKDKPVIIPVEVHEEEEHNNYKQKKKRVKTAPASNTDNEIEIVCEKVAPVFLQLKKQEAEKALKKAKQEFLLSSIPEALKQQVALQSALEQREVEIFPQFSHVTQIDPQYLPAPPNVILLNSYLKASVDTYTPKRTIFTSDLNRSTQEPSSVLLDNSNLMNVPKIEWSQCKEWIRHFKEDKFISFPFLRTLRELLPKGHTTEEHQWNDVCATQHWNENLANRSAVHHLKQWLKQWKLKTGDVVEVALKKKKARAASVKRKRIDSDVSEIDAELANDIPSSPEWDDPEELCNTMLIAGPAGCGKTASIYALAEELGFNVLEVNASSKRNGKSVLSQLHEATQSHTLSNSSGGSGVSKFFRPAAPTPKGNEQRNALSLVLFEDIDIVFEAEDESFYSALSTLMSNSKRPIILTFTCSNESAITPVTDKIKSRFETLHYTNPDLTSICGLLWSLLLAEGYPVRWDTLQNWVKSARHPADCLDLRCLLLDLQLRLFHHPLRTTLNFDQSNLSKEAPVPGAEDPPAEASISKEEIRFIDLPCQSVPEEWPVGPLTKSPRFIYSENEGFAYRTDRQAQLGSGEHSSDSTTKPASGDLNNFASYLNFRTFCDLSDSFRSRSHSLSLNDSSHQRGMEQLITSRCTKLWKSELERHHIADAVEPKLNRSATDVLLEEFTPKRIVLNRSACCNDILPYARSICRSELAHSIGKRRRIASSRQVFTFRFATSDVTLSSSAVLDLVNSL